MCSMSRIYIIPIKVEKQIPKNYLTLWISCRSLISLSVKSHSKRILKKNKQAYFFTRYKQHAHAQQKKKKIRWCKKLFSFCKWVCAITTATKFTDESNTICLSLEFQQVNNHVFLTSSHWDLPYSQPAYKPDIPFQRFLSEFGIDPHNSWTEKYH